MGVQVNRQDTKAKDFQVKLNLPAREAFHYGYSMSNNHISLNVPVKKKENTFSTLTNVKLMIEVHDVMKMDIKEIFIDRESLLELVKELQGRV